jgi:pimeloyl-ACP methyl ester carboxylesterase
MSLKAAAAAFSVSPATAHRWWRRWLDAGEEARGTRSCLVNRSSRPRRSPRRLAPELEEAICSCRRQTGWGPRLVAGATGFAHSTVWKVLKRAGDLAPAAGMRSLFGHGGSGVARAHLAKIKVPRAVIWGAKDTVDSIASGRKSAAMLGVSVEVVPHAGHLSMLANPTGVAELILRLDRARR